MQLQKHHFFLLITALLFNACTTSNSTPVEAAKRSLSQEAKAYWYAGVAEISSYELKQARYGEMRDGESVLIFVTEDFSPESGTKADQPNKNDVSVLKLNATKEFITGIYPYSMMSSTFFPMTDGESSLKISASSQEWCGHTYTELFNRDDKFDVQIASYFEGESGRFELKKHLLEDDLWSMIRLMPDQLPTGEQQVIPSFFYLRLMHRPAKAYQAEMSMAVKNDESIYTVSFPELERTMSIAFQTNFPHKILSWEETYPDGFGESKQVLTTTGTLKETIRNDYWRKNGVNDVVWRDSLMLNSRRLGN